MGACAGSGGAGDAAAAANSSGDAVTPSTAKTGVASVVPPAKTPTRRRNSRRLRWPLRYSSAHSSSTYRPRSVRLATERRTGSELLSTRVPPSRCATRLVARRGRATAATSNREPRGRLRTAYVPALPVHVIVTLLNPPDHAAVIYPEPAGGCNEGGGSSSPALRRSSSSSAADADATSVVQTGGVSSAARRNAVLASSSVRAASRTLPTRAWRPHRLTRLSASVRRSSTSRASTDAAVSWLIASSVRPDLRATCAR